MLESHDYGEVSYESDPADAQNPTWASLLDALRTVHQGDLPLSTLEAYHRELSQDLASKKSDLWAAVPPGEDPSGGLALGLGALTVTGLVLDQIQNYLQDPTPERMGSCVETLLEAQAITRGVEAHLERTVPAT